MVFSLASCLIKEDITTARDLLEDLAEKGHGVVPTRPFIVSNAITFFNILSVFRWTGPAMYTLALMLSPDVRKVKGGVEPDRQMEDDTKALKLYERYELGTLLSLPFSSLISHQFAVQHG